MEKLSIAIEDWELYNNGILACKWWDCDSDIEEIRDYYINLRKQHDIEPYNDLELFCADWEDDFLNLCSEHSNIEEIFNKYNEIDINEDQLEVLEYLINYLNYDLEDALKKLDDVEIYECNSFTELAEQFIDDGLFGEIPTNLVNYIDYESIGRDLSFDYDQYGDKIYRAS